MINRKAKQQGQVGLVILLVMVVLLTVGVSMASRSVTGLKISRQETESTRSLSLAEGGIETILSDMNTYIAAPVGQLTVQTANDVAYEVTSEDTLSNIQVAQGHTLEVMLTDGVVGPPADLIVDWTDGSCPDDVAAVEVTLISGTYGVQRYTGDTCGMRGNNFTGVGSTQLVVPLQAGDEIARVKVLYTSTAVSISSSGDLPTQVYRVKTWATLADGTTRAVQVNKLGASLPSIFDYVIFSGKTLVKN